jgi:hypothetical protein
MHHVVLVDLSARNMENLSIEDTFRMGRCFPLVEWSRQCRLLILEA